ncbi:hypothetical protein OAN33_06900 [Flavobacteriales bacterium]|nr:hypothetical protein [Flavobacteriales bacterium]
MKVIILAFFSLFALLNIKAQVSIGDQLSPNGYVILDLTNGNGLGLLLPYSAGNPNTNWYLCNGAPGTPNLSGFLIEAEDMSGAGTSDASLNGASMNKTIAVANLPSHTHAKGDLTITSRGEHGHTFNEKIRNTTSDGGGPGAATREWDGLTVTSNTIANTQGAHTHPITGSTAPTGSGTALNVKPAAKKRAYIIKVN